MNVEPSIGPARSARRWSLIWMATVVAGLIAQGLASGVGPGVFVFSGITAAGPAVILGILLRTKMSTWRNGLELRSTIIALTFLLCAGFTYVALTGLRMWTLVAGLVTLPSMVFAAAHALTRLKQLPPYVPSGAGHDHWSDVFE